MKKILNILDYIVLFSILFMFTTLTDKHYYNIEYWIFSLLIAASRFLALIVNR